nr:ruBisCO large subunit-binding protein subunit beta, chloroplastic [Ipomoea batatas]
MWLNPARARIGVVITMANNVGNTPSTLSFCIDVRGKAGENRFADVHELRLLYLEEGLIDEAVKVVATVANHVLITRGIEKTTKALVSELKNMSKEVEDSELVDVAVVSAGNNYEVGNMIVEAMSKVGRKGIVTLEEGKRSESNLRVVEGMQSDRGYISSYFVTDGEKMGYEKNSDRTICDVGAGEELKLVCGAEIGVGCKVGGDVARACGVLEIDCGVAACGVLVEDSGEACNVWSSGGGLRRGSVYRMGASL